MTGPAPDGPAETALAAASQSRRDAEAAEYTAITEAVAGGMTAYRAAQLTDRSANGIRHIIRRHQARQG